MPSTPPPYQALRFMLATAAKCAFAFAILRLLIAFVVWTFKPVEAPGIVMSLESISFYLAVVSILASIALGALYVALHMREAR